MTISLKFNKRFLSHVKRQLPLLPEERYSYFKSGDQSLVLKKGKDQILLATSYGAAKSIEIVRGCFSNNQSMTSLAIPTLVGIDLNIANLLNPDDPAAALRKIKHELKCQHTKTLTTNIVYELPRFSGTLEDIAELRFKDDSIEELSSSLRLALETLHKQGITHGDLALRNIFYLGTYPDYQFFLGDFGKASQTKRTFSKRCLKDIADLERLLETVQKTVRDKYNNSNKRQYIHLMLPSLSNAIRKRKGLSPFVPKTQTNDCVRSFVNKKKLKL